MIGIIHIKKNINIIIMINIKSFDYIPDDKKQECYKSMVNDIYFFYYGIKPSYNDIIICIDDNPYNLDKNNLLLKKMI